MRAWGLGLGAGAARGAVCVLLWGDGGLLAAQLAAAATACVAAVPGVVCVLVGGRMVVLARTMCVLHGFCQRAAACVFKLENSLFTTCEAVV